MTTLNKTAIARLARDHGMIAPFAESLVRVCDGRPVLSYGLGSHGYDLRLSPRDFRYCKPVRCVNPKRPDAAVITDHLLLQHDDDGSFFTMPPHSFCFGVAMEMLRLPTNVVGNVRLKSSYQRAHVTMSTGRVQAGWCGHLTLEFANVGPSPVRMYAGEGVVEVEFVEVEPCEGYAGQYQDQPDRVVLGALL